MAIETARYVILTNDIELPYRTKVINNKNGDWNSDDHPEYVFEKNKVSEDGTTYVYYKRKQTVAE